MREVGFIAPVYVGDIVSFYATILRQGRTSVTVQVVVEAESSKEPRRHVKVTEAEVIYVAVDEEGKPLPLR
jgi:acyl-CoA thioesterase YciA